jgi:adenylate cyclase
MAFDKHIGTSASEDRLEKLIKERMKPDTSTDEVDKRIWDLFGETWSVMFTDLSGFSRGVEKFGIIHFLQMIFESNRLFAPIIDRFDGILLKTEGDSLMILFRNPAKAMKAAIVMQRRLKDYNVDKEPEEQILLCVGIGYGHILKIGDDDVFGAEVNAASKLGEDMAEPWEILVTESVKAAINSPDLEFEVLDKAPSGAEAAYRVSYPLD